MRIASWNLNWASEERAARLGDLLQRESVTIAALQEANPVGLDAFCDAAGLDWWVSPLTTYRELLEARGRARSGRRQPRSVAIAGTGTAPSSLAVFPDLPLVEKVVVGWVPVGELGPTAIVAYHAPAGVQHKQKKPAQAVQVARWLAEIDGPALLGGDFNTPVCDHPDHEEIRTHWHTGNAHLDGAPGDDLLVGPNEVHNLRDALRVWLSAHPEALERRRARAPKGPLAVSYHTTPSHAYRYDAIWVSDHFAVRDVDYYYDEAIEAGSDHALVVADLEYSGSD